MEKVASGSLLFLLIVKCMTVQVESSGDCQPFGLRLGLGNKYQVPTSAQTLLILFNTKTNCSKSYVMIELSGESPLEISCKSDPLLVSGYQTFIQNCSITQVQPGQSFHYMAYGWQGDDSSPIPFTSSSIGTRIPGEDQEIKMIVLGDWGYLREKKEEKSYQPLTESFDRLIDSKIEIDAIYIGGDVAYDLDSNEGKNYEDFLKMLSQISSLWPLIFCPGNHEYKSNDDEQIMISSFPIYGIMDRHVTSINFHQFSLLIFDPYDILYRDEPQKSILENFEEEIKGLKKRGKPIIAASHYPLLCSGKSSCRETEGTLRSFYEMMVDEGVALYIGAHWHSYERVYPYVKNATTIKIQPPYQLSSSEPFLPSVLEGIAGNDQGIVTDVEVIEPWTAALCINQTGFGVLSVNSSSYTYQHYSTLQIEPADQFSSYFETKTNLRTQ